MTYTRTVGVVQDYAWGLPGSANPLVARFNHKDVPIDDQRHYAEYWFGCHAKGPAKVAGTENLTLSQWLSDQQDLTVSQMPYLSKILSIGKPLSIQLHPDQQLASRLHEQDPSHYPDSNEKPEVCYTLTPFELFLGFKPPKQIRYFVKHLTPLTPFFVDINWRGTDKEVLKACMKVLYAMTDSEVQSTIEELRVMQPAEIQQLSKGFFPDFVRSLIGSENYSEELQDAQLVLQELAQEYPGDRGVLVSLFLQHLKLSKGTCIIIPPNVVHAYIKGECCEIMKESDNVIRAGLTSKFTDAQNLLDALQYKPYDSTKYNLKPHTLSPFFKAYVPTITDAFRFYVFEGVLPSITELPLPRWTPMQVLCLSGISKLKIDTPNSKSCISLTIGQCYTITSWDTISLVPATENSTSNVLAIFVMPNIDQTRIRRSKRDYNTVSAVTERRTSVTSSQFMETRADSGNKSSRTNSDKEDITQNGPSEQVLVSSHSNGSQGHFNEPVPNAAACFQAASGGTEVDNFEHSESDGDVATSPAGNINLGSQVQSVPEPTSPSLSSGAQPTTMPPPSAFPQQSETHPKKTDTKSQADTAVANSPAGSPVKTKMQATTPQSAAQPKSIASPSANQAHTAAPNAASKSDLKSAHNPQSSSKGHASQLKSTTAQSAGCTESINPKSVTNSKVTEAEANSPKSGETSPLTETAGIAEPLGSISTTELNIKSPAKGQTKSNETTDHIETSGDRSVVGQDSI